MRVYLSTAIGTQRCHACNIERGGKGDGVQLEVADVHLFIQNRSHRRTSMGRPKSAVDTVGSFTYLYRLVHVSARPPGEVLFAGLAAARTPRRSNHVMMGGAMVRLMAALPSQPNSSAPALLTN